MSALALHFREPGETARWILSSAIVVASHIIVIGAIVFWYTRVPREDNIIPAIAISFAPAAPTLPEPSDEAIDEKPVEAVEAAPTPPPPPPKVEPLPEEVEPPPPRPAEIALPKPEPKPIEKKPVERPPPPPPPRESRETAAMRDAMRQASVAASNAYNSLVFGHLQRFKRYPPEANGASGTVVVRFVLNRKGDVISGAVAKSSGSAALDEAALALLRRASPFPPFPESKPGSQDGFTAPLSYSH